MMTTDQMLLHDSSLNEFVALVVDNDSASRLILRGLIESQGGHVIEAENSSAAQTVFGVCAPDIVLLSVTPETGGFEACAQIRALPNNVDTPVLTILDLDDEATVDRALAAGAADYVTKPIRAAILRQRVRRLIQVHNIDSAILRAKREWEAAFDAVSDMIILTDLHGKIIRCNQATTQRLETTYTELIGRDLKGILLQNTGQELNLPFREPREMQFPSLPGWFELRTFPGHLEGRWHTIVYILKDITERKQLEESMRQSEQRFKALVENISEGVELFDATGQVCYASPMVAHILGMPEGTDLLGLNPMDHLHPEDLEQGFPLFLQMLQTPGGSFTFEMRTQHADGSWIWAEATARNMLTEPGINAILMNFRDITQHKQLEEALRQSEQRFKALVENISEGIQLIGADGKTIYASPTAMRMTGFTQEDIRFNPFEFVHPDDLPSSLELFNQLLQHPEHAIVTELRTRHQKGTWIWVEVTGRNLLTEPGIEAILVNFKDITERKQDELKFRQLSQAVEQSPVSIIITSPTGNIEYVNPRFTQLTGYTSREVIGQNPRLLKSDQTPPETFAQLWAAISSGREWQGEFINRKKSGELFIEWASISPVVDEKGIVTHFLALKEDITERKQLEESLRQSEKRFRAMIENSADAIALVDATGRITYATPAIAGISGYEPEDYVGHEASEFIHAEDLPELVDGFRELARASGCVSTRLFRSQHIDGSWRWVNVTTSNQLSDPAVNAIIANFRDVTEGKRAEEILRVSEARYRTLFEDSPVALWEEDYSEVKGLLDHLRTEEGITDFRAYFEAHPEAVAECAAKVIIRDVNKAAMKLTGAERKEQLFETFDKIVALETSSTFRDQLISIASGCTHYTFEGPNCTLNGEIRHVSVLWSVCPGYEDSLSNVIVSVMDLTERKRAEEMLKQTEERLRLIVETVPIPILIGTAAEGTVLFANTALGEMIGLPVAELLGRRTSDFYVDPSQRQLLVEMMNREGELHNYELAIKNVDQKPLWVLVSLRPLTFGDQPATLAALYDVTDRRQTEEALRASQADLSQALQVAKLGYWEYDFPNDLFIFNDHFYSVFHTTAEQEDGYTMSAAGYAQRFCHPDDRDVVADEIHKALKSTDQHYSTQLDHRILYADGGVGYISVRANLDRDEQGQILRFYGANQDVTERKHAEEALHLSQERFEMVAHATNDAVWDLNLSTGERWWNSGVRSLFGYSTDPSALDQTWWESQIHPDDRTKVLASFQAALSGDGQFWSKEYRFRRANGTYAYVFDRGYISQDEHGIPVRVLGAMMDLTDRKQSEDALRTREQQLEEAQRTARLGSWEWDFRTNISTWSEELYRLCDWDPRSITPSREAFLGLIHPDDRDRAMEIVGQTFQTHQPYDFDYRIISAKGETRWLHGHGEFMQDEKTGQALRFRGTAQDITERKQAEETLRASQTALSEALQIAHLGSWEWDFRTNVCTWSDELYRLFGYEPRSITPDHESFFAFAHPDDRDSVIETIRRTFHNHQPYDFDFRIISVKDELRWLHGHGEILKDKTGQCVRFRGTAQDITERKHMEEALVKSEELFSKAFHASPAPMGITRVDDGMIIDVNGSWERLFGYDRQAATGRPIMDLHIYADPQDRTTIIQQIYEQGKVMDYEVKVKTKSEEDRIVLMSAQIVEIHGQACLMSTFHDITEQRRLHETMLASQKLADLGTLAAGVAHEMNSPLQVITGLSQSLLKRLINHDVDPERFQHNLDVIQRNGWRCAEIVRSLHTYARNSGGPMEPADLNELVSDGLLLIEHQLKSWANISVRTILAEDLPALTCDRNQITQVLINLLTNARDAMRNGGEITVATGYDLKSSRLILQISDAGVGIPDSIRSKIFDPFFTTKPLGKGTGLGLSIVAGIVRAHGGTISINGALPQGTTFTMRFPTEPPRLPAVDTVDTPGRFDDIATAHVSTSEQTNFVKEPSHDQDSSR